MTDKMFEYALVFSDHIEPHFAPFSIADIEKICRSTVILSNWPGLPCIVTSPRLLVRF